MEPIRVIEGTTFGLIGDGYISHFHREAIKSHNGQIVWVCDPKYKDSPKNDGPHYLKSLDEVAKFYDPENFGLVDYVVICSPSYLHQEHIRKGLELGVQVICEKPMCLPWEGQPVVDDRVNVVLQLRYLPALPEKAEKITVRMVRSPYYFETWKGNAKLTGGLFYNLFIHYIDLAIMLNADFVGQVTAEGEQRRQIHVTDTLRLDITTTDPQVLYDQMYLDILSGGGVKPSELQYLHWLLNRVSDGFGYGKNAMDKRILIPRELL